MTMDDNYHGKENDNVSTPHAEIVHTKNRSNIMAKVTNSTTTSTTAYRCIWCDCLEVS